MTPPAAAVPVTYPTWDAAAARVERLVRDAGVWPGITGHDGEYALTYDPEVAR